MCVQISTEHELRLEGNLSQHYSVRSLEHKEERPAYHTGLLRDGIVFDSIYPLGIPLGWWEGGAYTVAVGCPNDSTDEKPFAVADAMGIGKITID